MSLLGIHVINMCLFLAVFYINVLRLMFFFLFKKYYHRNE